MREWLYGRQAVREMLRAQRRQVRQLLVNRGSEPGGVLGAILELAQARGITVAEADRNRLDQLSQRANHPGVVAEVAAYPYVELDDILDAAQAKGEPAFVLCHSGCKYMSNPHTQPCSRQHKPFPSHKLQRPLSQFQHFYAIPLTVTKHV